MKCGLSVGFSYHLTQIQALLPCINYEVSRAAVRALVRLACGYEDDLSNADDLKISMYSYPNHGELHLSDSLS